MQVNGELDCTTVNNCGAFGQKCNTGFACVAGQCVNNNPSILNFKFSYKMYDVNGQCNVWPLSVKVATANGVNSNNFDNINLKKEEMINGNQVFSASVVLTGFKDRDGLMVYLKGPKHIWTKYGMNGQSSFFRERGGQISLTDSVQSSPVYDFSQYPILSGDINGDGVVNNTDYSFVKSEALKRVTCSPGQNLMSDLDGNCIVNAIDVANILQTLDESYGQDY